MLTMIFTEANIEDFCEFIFFIEIILPNTAYSKEN